MASTVTLKAAGLNTSPNQLELPEGSLIEAKNVVIRRDDVVEQIRGFRVFGVQMGTLTDRAKQLFEYRDRIFRHYSTVLQFQDGVTNSGEVDFTSFSQSVVETQDGLRIKKVESNGNLYFTTSEGIKKISAIDGNGLSTAQITNAGGIKAVDMTASLIITPGDQGSFLPQDSAVAYRVVWATKDANNNLILGTPSQREEVYNPMGPLILRDYLIVLRALDGVSDYSVVSLISDGDYVSTLKLPLTATAVELQTNLISLATKIDQDILLGEATVTTAPLDIDAAGSTVISSGVYTVNFTSGDPTDYVSAGSKIYLTGFTPVTGTLDGIQTVTNVTSSSLSFNTTATGVVTVGASATIESGVFRNIEQPAVPGIPTTNQELQTLQDYLQSIIVNLQILPSTGTPPTLNSAARTEWIDPIDLTKTASVQIQITIPEGITTDYFYQLYRSSIAQATGPVALDDIVPSDELQLVYEAYPTSAEISAGEVDFIDVTPDEFRGANLYTNPATGEGILQSNDLPPLAKDINRFKNVVFFANTQTRQRMALNLLGTQIMLTDFNNGTVPKVSIISEDATNTYSFVKGEYEASQITCNAAATLANSGTADYFLIYSANDKTEYYVWYAIGTAADPAISGKIGIKVELGGAEADTVVASRTADALASYAWDFAAEPSTNQVVVLATDFGATTDTDDGTTGFVFVTTQQGVGEDAALKQVLLADLASVALSVDETARSLIRVINKNPDESVYAYYLSGSNDVPGKIQLESKSLQNKKFYLIANNANTGTSFNPDISGDFVISAISTGISPTITTVTPHGLVNGNSVILAQTNSTPTIDGVYPVYEVTTNTFTIDLTAPVTIAGTAGQAISATNAASSDNEIKQNRVYYSKLSQPEAVPILNYLDVGDADKAILRIFPLRDSLFVFKEEGLYRISGETAPFTLALFDSSCQLSAPDTVDVNNNLIYLLTTQGVMTVSEGSPQIITRPIDNIILRIPIFPNYKSLSFGVGYESDNSYTLWTVQRSSDASATIGFRYSNLTNSWTTVDRKLTCGFVNPVDDKSYHGAADINFIEQERKEFDRYDYSEREYEFDLIENNYNGTQLRLTTVDNIAIGDVFVQTQDLTCYEYNMLLKKLDYDPSVGDDDYFETLEASAGNSLRTKIQQLATKLDADPGVQGTNYAASIAVISKTINAISTDSPSVITTTTAHGLLTGREIVIAGSNSSPTINGDWAVTVTGASTFTIPASVSSSGTTGSVNTLQNSFEDIKACYNIIINKLNTDNGVSFSNYREIDNQTVQEAVVLDINRQQKKVTLNLALDFIVGPLILFKAIDSAFTYGPNTFGNPISYKHFSESTVMFENKAFTSAKLQFATDLLPEFQTQEFNGDGNGIFGFQVNFGDGFFGGASNSAPFRTWVPRQCQRARYLTVRFNHRIARENYRIFGTTITGNDTGSTRAYRS